MSASFSLAPGHRTSVLRAYRELLVLIKRLKPEESSKAWDEVRAKVRLGKEEKDAMKATDMLKDLISRVGFLRMRTPRYPSDALRFQLPGRFVVREGAVVEGEGQRVEGAEYKEGLRGVPVDKGAFASKHEALLSRQLSGAKAPRGWAPRDVQVERALKTRKPGQPIGEVLRKR